MSELREKILKEIRGHGPIPFSRYMELCLYDPEFGYYSRNVEQFGKAGDFYTSSDVHAVFGRLMARQFEEMWRALGSPERILLRELGPGRGLFARDVLDWSEKKFPEFFRALTYVPFERSPALCARIQTTLKRHFESGKAVIENADFAAGVAGESTLGAPTIAKGTSSTRAGQPSIGVGALASEITIFPVPTNSPTILFANEFFDALPVEVISPRGSLRIDARNHHFVETWAQPSAEELEFLDRYAVHPEPDERIEATLIGQQYAADVFASLDRGFAVIIDYGYTRDEQLAGRHRGTLKAIRRHSLSADPYEAPGEQDITADVNFSALASAAQKQGWHPHKLVTQSQFLMGIGEATQFADAFEECRLPQERAKVALQLKHLVTPAGMGESFHVFVASKGVEAEKAAALSGLTFGYRNS